MLAVLRQRFPEREWQFSGNGGFGTHPLARLCRRHRRCLTLASKFYAARWSTETTFQEMRTYRGLEATHGNTQNTVRQTAPCLFGLYSVVALYYAALPSRGL